MSTVDTNFSINNIPHIDRYHNESLKAPAVDQIQKEQINLDESMKNLKRPNEVSNPNLIIENDKKKIQSVSKKPQRKKNNPAFKNKEKKRDTPENNGLFVDMEC